MKRFYEKKEIRIRFLFGEPEELAVMGRRTHDGEPLSGGESGQDLPTF